MKFANKLVMTDGGIESVAADYMAQKSKESSEAGMVIVRTGRTGWRDMEKQNSPLENDPLSADVEITVQGVVTHANVMRRVLAPCDGRKVEPVVYYVDEAHPDGEPMELVDFFRRACAEALIEESCMVRLKDGWHTKPLSWIGISKERYEPPVKVKRDGMVLNAGIVVCGTNMDYPIPIPFYIEEAGDAAMKHQGPIPYPVPGTSIES